MKVWLKILSMAVLVMFTSKVSAEQAPISVELGQHYNQLTKGFNPLVTVTSDVDNIAIRDIVINRGNCKVFANDLGQLRRKLGYGQSVTYRTNTCDRIREVVVTTDQGTWTYTMR